jgi:excisionase family DNA binding protein
MDATTITFQTRGSLHLPDRPVLTVKEAAAILGVNVKTLYAEIHAGKFPAFRVGRVIRISTTVLASFVDRGIVAAPGEIQAGRDRSA